MDNQAQIRRRPVIRVFVSSTFTDLKHERDALQRDVFPKLEQLCASRQFQFQAIDLRWGVPTEASLDHRTMRICFEELRRSQEISPQPNFLILLGNRYGWRPLPEEVSEDEFRRLESTRHLTPSLSPLSHKHLIRPSAAFSPSDAEKEIEAERESAAGQILRAWYRRDENAVPPVYLLQSRKKNLNDGKDYTNDQVWNEVQRVLWDVINRAYPAAQLAGRFDRLAALDEPLPPIVRFQASATEQEIWRGALGASNARQHVLAFVREIENAGEFQPVEVRDFVDVDESGAINAVSQDALRELKQELRKRLEETNIIGIENARLKKEGPSAEISTGHLEELCARVHAALKDIITRQMDEYWGTSDPIVVSPRELELECSEHQRFGQERAPADSFIGRERHLQAIQDYLHNDSKQPLVIHGASGCGKTALLAKAVQEVTSGAWRVAGASSQKPEDASSPSTINSQPSPVIYRFIGVTPRSSDVRSLLASLCQELRQRHPLESPLPGDVRELSAELNEHFKTATAQAPLILFLDALDQLVDTDNGPALFWIPFGQLPNHVKLVVSCLSDRAPEDPASRPYTTLKGRKLPEENFINLDALSENEAETLFFERWLPQARRKLNAEQAQCIRERLKSDACRQPLYLKVLFEEARLWRSDDPAPTLGNNVSELLGALFDRLRSPANHGATVKYALGYLAAARRGLTEMEILEVLYHDRYYKKLLERTTAKTGHKLPDNPKRIPIAIWSRLRFDLAPYLTEHAAPGGTVLNFYHRQVAEFVRGQFLDTPLKRQQRHERLAGYFQEKADPGGDRTWSGHSLRGFDELPFQLASSHSQNEWVSVMGDAAFAAAKASKRASFDLLNDYNIASSRVDRHVAGYLRLLQLKQIVRREAERLNRYPECSHQQVLMGIGALAEPDPGLSSQAKSLVEVHRGGVALKVWSLVPEHRVRLVSQVPVEADLKIENSCLTQTGILLRYKGGKWAEYSTDLEKTRSGVTPAAYCTRIARGGGTLVLTSAITATVWNPWPIGTPKSCRFGVPISAAACSNDDRFLVLGGSDGSFQIRDLEHVEADPLLTGKIEGSVIAGWFVSGDSVIFVNDTGVLIHAIGGGSWKVSNQVATGRNCRLACSAGGDATCLAGDGDIMQCYDGEGRLKWQVRLPSKPFSLAFAPGKNEDQPVVLVGLDDGTLQETSSRDGHLGRITKVCDSAIRAVEGHPTAESVLCADSAGNVFIVSRSLPDEVEFRSWSACRRVLATHWNETAQRLETLAPDGERWRLQKRCLGTDEDWEVLKMRSIGGPLDDAWLFPDGKVVALHRESDESQIWLHRPCGRDNISSKRLWRGNSLFNLAGPIYIHTMAVSPCGTRYALAQNSSDGSAFSLGRLGRFTFGPRWQLRESSIHELVLSDRGEVIVITQDRGTSAIRLPARLLTCGMHTHVLLEEGWGGGVTGRERGAAQALFGSAISRDGRTIAAIDANHALWLFSFDPHHPQVRPCGTARLQGIVACSLSDSGLLCSALQSDRAIAIYQVEDGGRLLRLATVLPPSQPSCFRISEPGRRLIVAGQDFIQAVSF